MSYERFILVMVSSPLKLELTLSGRVELPYKEFGHHMVPTKPFNFVSFSNFLSPNVRRILSVAW